MDQSGQGEKPVASQLLADEIKLAHKTYKLITNVLKKNIIFNLTVDTYDNYQPNLFLLERFDQGKLQSPSFTSCQIIITIEPFAWETFHVLKHFIKKCFTNNLAYNIINNSILELSMMETIRIYGKSTLVSAISSLKQ